MWRRHLGLAIGLLAGALLSCRPGADAVADGDDPLAALAAPAQSARYSGPFWTREAHRNSGIWQAAKTFCAANRQLPNCHAVELVRRWEEPLTLPLLPPPPALYRGEPGYQGADVAALHEWEARLLALSKQSAQGEPR